MSYTTDDFSESIARWPLKASEIECVLSAWGKGSGMGEDAGHFKWADDGATEWSGGFLMRLKDGRYAYLTGWCDYTGWGCQDGVEVFYFDAQPDAATILVGSGDTHAPDASEWDIEPADLNRWLALESAKAAGAVDPDAGTVSE